MKSNSLCLVLASLLIITSVIKARIIYHPEYPIKAGKAISGYLRTSDVIFTPARRLAAMAGKENAFLDSSPFRAYVDLSRPENAKKLIDSHLKNNQSIYHIVEKEIPKEELRKIHSDLHVKELLNDPRVIATIGEMDFLANMHSKWPRLRKYEESLKPGLQKSFISWLRSALEGYNPEFFRNKVVRPFLLQAQGTLNAVDIVLKDNNGPSQTYYKWAINLGGGFHHAKDKPAGDTIEERLKDYQNWGNCSVSDQGLAALRAHEKYGINNILLIDLDAHQGNGNAIVFKLLRDKYPSLNAHIFDMYNSESSGYYPPDQHDIAEKGLIKYRHPLKRKTSGEDYLRILKDELPKAIGDMGKPGLIIYNAGTDPLKGDPEGILSLSKDDMIERDEIVFSLAKEYNIPIISNTSGGYTKECAPLIAASFKNLHKKGLAPFNN